MIPAFVAKIHQYLSNIDDVHIPPFLSEWPTAPFKTRPVTPCGLPVLSFLQDAVSTAPPESADIVQMLAASAKDLAWGRTYSAGEVGTAFLEKYGWTELIGLRGPAPSRRVACGFLLLGPDIEYPMHRHDAEEIYIPLTPNALWRKGKDDWAAGPAGVPIYHGSRQPHGVRTGPGPLLALYIWRGGDLVQKSHMD